MVYQGTVAILPRLHANELAQSSFHYHYHHHPRRLAVYWPFFFFFSFFFFFPQYIFFIFFFCLFEADWPEVNNNQVTFQLKRSINYEQLRKAQRREWSISHESPNGSAWLVRSTGESWLQAREPWLQHTWIWFISFSSAFLQPIRVSVWAAVWPTVESVSGVAAFAIHVGTFDSIDDHTGWP